MHKRMGNCVEKERDTYLKARTRLHVQGEIENACCWSVRSALALDWNFLWSAVIARNLSVIKLDEESVLIVGFNFNPVWKQTQLNN